MRDANQAIDCDRQTAENARAARFSNPAQIRKCRPRFSCFPSFFRNPMNPMINVRRQLKTFCAGVFAVPALIGAALGAPDPSSISAGLAETVEGRVVALAVDDWFTGSGRTLYFVNDPRGAVEVSFPNGSPHRGDVVRVTGTRVGRAIDCHLVTDDDTELTNAIVVGP